MVILGFLGSPRLHGKCSTLLKRALEGAESEGAQTKRFDLIKCNIMHCRGCLKCIFENHEMRLSDYSTVRILAGGLNNHLTNGFQRQRVSAEVDRAIENRAYSEIELLREQTSMDWLWNLGALAPLLGLLGTVTGISKVFFEIKDLTEGTSHLELVQQLSSGIFEALWTTIYGLSVGIILVTIYYYYKNILDWIYQHLMH